MINRKDIEPHKKAWEVDRDSNDPIMHTICGISGEAIWLKRQYSEQGDCDKHYIETFCKDEGFFNTEHEALCEIIEREEGIIAMDIATLEKLKKRAERCNKKQ